MAHDAILHRAIRANTYRCVLYDNIRGCYNGL